SRADPGAAQVHFGRLPLVRRLAVAGQARRAQGAVGQLPALRPRRRPVARRRLGRLGPPEAGDRPSRLLPANEVARGLAPRAPAPPAGGPPGAGPLADPVAQRGRPRVRAADGRLLPRLRPRRGASPWVYFGSGAGLGAPREGEGGSGEEERVKTITI